MPPASRIPFRERALVAVLGISGEWTGRLLILDPGTRSDARTVDWLATLAPHLAAALYSLYLLRRLRSRVTVVERTRLARELHDGLIQTLEIARAQEQYGEVVNARELMERLKSVTVNPADLTGRLADLALDDLDRTRRGPALIKERVRGIRGDMVIDSRPGRGTSLQISIPRA